jgi:hypothetical protein
LLLLLGGAVILRIVQLLTLEQTVEVPAPSTKFATSSMQDKRGKMPASSASTIRLMRQNGRHSIKKDICS